VGSHQDVAPEGEANFEYGHGFHLRAGPVRGLESYLQQRNLWYSMSRVTTIGTTQVLYLPHEWLWTVAISGVRTAFPASLADWSVSGFTRLGIPVSKRVTASGTYAVGAENFSTVDQVGHFSARTFAGAVRVQLSDMQDVSASVAYQDRSQRRTQTTVGISYGIRF
jgi:hypothetical protein